MQSPRALGFFALGAVILAAIAFAAVDVSLSAAADGESLPPFAIFAAVIGTVALLASVLPAITWFVDTIHHSRHDADIEPMAVAVTRAPFDDDDL